MLKDDEASWIIGLLRAPDKDTAAALQVGILSDISAERYNELTMAMKTFTVNIGGRIAFNENVIPFVQSLHLNDTESLVMGAILAAMFTADGMVSYGKRLAKERGIDYKAFLREMKKCPCMEE